MSIARLTLIGKPGCHLCDEARDVVTSVIRELAPAASVALEELSIMDDVGLAERYRDEIPVLLINGEPHSTWRVDPERLALAIREATA